MNLIKKFKKCIVVGLLIIGYIIFVFVSNLQPADKIQIAILLTLISTFIVAWWQLDKFTTQQKETYFWNKKMLALTELEKTREPIAAALMVMQEHFNYSKRDITNPIDYKEIHDKICEKDEQGNCIGLTEDGRIIRRHIVTVLNKYEYLAAGVNEDMFDIVSIEKLVKSSMINTFKMFQPYINHLRTHHKQDNVCAELEILVMKFEGKEDTSAKPRY